VKQKGDFPHDFQYSVEKPMKQSEIAKFRRIFQANEPSADGTLERAFLKKVTVGVKLSGEDTEDI